MSDAASHQYDSWQAQWDLARRRAASGDLGSAVFTLVMLAAMLRTGAELNDEGQTAGLPRWLVDEVVQILAGSIQRGEGLDEQFHLVPKRGRNLMKNEMRDMEIDALANMYPSLEALAHAGEVLGLEPPTPGSVWTADTLAKAINAHARRIKSGLLFTGQTAD